LEKGKQGSYTCRSLADLSGRKKEIKRKGKKNKPKTRGQLHLSL
jgi:hypothetical protein